MKTIQDYLDDARAAIGINSDRALAAALEASVATVNTWRSGRSLPTDEKMVDLAALSGASKEQALLHLSYWRADGEARKTYENLIKRLGVTAACAVVLVFAGFSPVPAQAKTNIMGNDVVYYGN